MIGDSRENISGGHLSRWIFHAGIEQDRSADDRAASLPIRAGKLRLCRCPNGHGDTPQQPRIFLDSGAYTSFTKGIRIDIRRYADFIRQHRDIVEVASNLDVIGEGQEKLSFERLKKLERLLAPDGLDYLLLPVHHVRDRDTWLRRYLDEGYDYIALGGMVGEPTAVLTRWLDHVWSRFLTNPDGTPKIKVHGFGMTRPSLMARYPWHSVDSTSWVFTMKNGGLMLDLLQKDQSIKDFKIDFSERSSERHLHYNTLSPIGRRAVDRRLEAMEADRIRDPDLERQFRAKYGCELRFDPLALSKSYGLRAIGNIAYYHRVVGRAKHLTRLLANDAEVVVDRT